METADEEGYWSYKSVKAMETRQYREDITSEVVLTSVASPQSPDINIWNSPNIATSHHRIVSGAFLGVVLLPFEPPRVPRGISCWHGNTLSNEKNNQFPVEYDLDKACELASLLEIQKVVKFANRFSIHNDMVKSNKYDLEFLAEFIVAKLHSTLLGVKCNGNFVIIDKDEKEDKDKNHFN